MDDDGIVVAMLSIPTGRRGPSPSWESCGPGNSDLSRVVAQILQIVVLVFRSTRSDGTACRVEGNLIGFEILEHDAQRSATTSTPTWPFASGLRGADRRRLEYSRTVGAGRTRHEANHGALDRVGREASTAQGEIEAKGG